MRIFEIASTISTTAVTSPAPRLISGKVGSVDLPSQCGKARSAICIITSITITPAISGVRTMRASSAIALLPRTGTDSAHQISEATQRDPKPAPRLLPGIWPNDINAAKTPA